MRAKFINEIQNFERGLDPLDSMNIGRVAERKYAKVKGNIIRAMNIIVHDYNLNEENIKDETIAETICLIYSKNEEGYKEEFYIGFNPEEISGNFPAYYYVGYNSDYNNRNWDESHLKTLELCMNQLREWLDKGKVNI
jgi:hypothetical protein